MPVELLCTHPSFNLAILKTSAFILALGDLLLLGQQEEPHVPGPIPARKCSCHSHLVKLSNRFYFPHNSSILCHFNTIHAFLVLGQNTSLGFLPWLKLPFLSFLHLPSLWLVSWDPFHPKPSSLFTQHTLPGQFHPFPSRQLSLKYKLSQYLGR